jgi:hypothetical protein
MALKQLNGKNTGGGSTTIFVNPACVVAVTPTVVEQGKSAVSVVFLTNGESLQIVGTVREIAVILNGE